MSSLAGRNINDNVTGRVISAMTSKIVVKKTASFSFRLYQSRLERSNKHGSTHKQTAM
jgi:hypothetical protein